MNQQPIKQRVLLTVAYSDQFEQPLTVDEIHRRLIGRCQSKDEVLSALSQLMKNGMIDSQGEYYYLVGREQLLEVRRQREKNSMLKQTEIAQFVKWVQWMPWIRAVAVTGSVAVNNAQSHTDVDYLVVTAPRRLWLARISVALVAWIKGARRTWGGNEADSWCFNMWLDTNHLQLPHTKREVYEAYEMCQCQWVLDKGLYSGWSGGGQSVSLRYYQENQWVERWLECFYKTRVAEAYDRTRDQTDVDLDYQPAPYLQWVVARILDLIDWVAFQLQRGYMFPHMTRELVGRGQAFFHPRDTRSQIFSGWRRSLKRVIQFLHD